MDCKDIKNLIFMAMCSYGVKAYIISIFQDTTLNYIFNEIVERWKHLSPTMIDIKFYIPNNSRMLITFMTDKDIRNMYKYI